MNEVERIAIERMIAEGDGKVTNEELITLASGATRSKVPVNWHLLPTSALRAYEQRMTLGAGVHGPKNWMKGQPFSVIYNHMMEHLMKLREFIESGERYQELNPDSEVNDLVDGPIEDAAAVMWGAAAIIYFMKQCSDPNIQAIFYEEDK